MIGRLLCRVGFHMFTHYELVAWRMYRKTCERCGEQVNGLI